MRALMPGSTPARCLRRIAPLCALALLAVFALGEGSAGAKSSRRTPASYYVVKSAKVKCKVHYTKQTVTLKVRRHHAWAHVHQVRCVYTGNGAGANGGGGGVPSFPLNLPTAGITVTAIPTAAADSYTIAANQTLSVGATAGVLANDSGLGLSAALVSGATHGTVTLDRNGAFHYTPAAGYSGIDAFSYHATDGSGESSGAAQVTVHVTPLGAAPDAYSVGASATLSVGAPGLLTGALGSGLRAQLASGATHGSVTVNSDGSFSYTSDGGFAGIDSFQFVVVDGAGQSSPPLTVQISVGVSAPSVVDQTFAGAVGNTELQVGGARAGGAEVYLGNASALANDTDPSGGTLSTQQASIPTAHGGIVSLGSDGSFNYQPPVGFSGPSDSFSYQVLSSEGASAQANATIYFSGARVWYVDASASAGGDGTSEAPFDSLAAVSAPGGAAGSGDVVFVFAGSYGGGIGLAANETLVGAPAGLTVASESLIAPSGGANPVITDASPSSAGVSLADGDNVSAVTVNATAGAGISAANANSFTIASSVSVTNAGADGIDVSGGGGNASVGATVTGSGGHAVEVTSRTSGTLTFTGAISDQGDGLLLTSNTNATVNFAGAITAATTNSHPAFEAVGGGTVTATSGSSSLGSADAAALDISNTTIGTDGLAFQTVDSGSSPSAGPADGVILSNTGAGTVAIAGGTIQGTTAAGVSAANSGAVRLTGMLLEPASGDGVSASEVTSLSVKSLTITGGATGIDASGDAQSFDIETNHLSGQSATAIALAYSGTGIGSVVGNDIGSEGSPTLTGSVHGDGIDVSSTGGGTLTAAVTSNTVDQIQQGNGIFGQAASGSTLDLTLTSNNVEMDSATSQVGVLVQSSGAVCLNPMSNIVSAAGSAAAANAMEIDQLVPGAVFALQSYVSDPVALLATDNPQLSIAAGGGGTAAVAVASDGFTAPSTPGGCASSGGSGSI
jgi:hypothetical protein